MARPNGLAVKIFLDGGIPEETREAIRLLGFLDGQTTNPTLIAKGARIAPRDPWEYYRAIVGEISPLVREGSVSVEVYADRGTAAEKMITQAKELFGWIPNAHIKLPITKEGLRAAEQLAGAGVRVNMTLCFSEDQAAAVYAATRGAKKGSVFISPFIGRLDDRGENGMSLIENILALYRAGDGHVEVLTASVRNLDHFLAAIALGSDIVTAPLKVLKEWADKGMRVPGGEYQYPRGDLRDIPKKDLDLGAPWQEFDIDHELTEKGLDRFAEDWNRLIARE